MECADPGQIISYDFADWTDVEGGIWVPGIFDPCLLGVDPNSFCSASSSVGGDCRFVNNCNSIIAGVSYDLTITVWICAFINADDAYTVHFGGCSYSFNAQSIGVGFSQVITPTCVASVCNELYFEKTGSEPHNLEGCIFITATETP